MDPLIQTQLCPLMEISSGSPDVVIGLIDGPIDFDHSAFNGSRIRTSRDSQLGACKKSSNTSCIHGTFVAGILCAQRGFSAPGICPNCEVILKPVFKDRDNNNDGPAPHTDPEELSNAMIELVNAGAKIINLSLGLKRSSLVIYHKLQEAYAYALQKSVVIVIAAGNQGSNGAVSLYNHPWVIPVAMCDEENKFVNYSNFGFTIGKSGLMAPGVNITSTSPAEGYIQLSGTSVAAPFVTGTIALLMSIFPTATAAEIIHSLRTGSSHNRRNIIPPLLNAEAALKILNNSR